jgi:hypothetical protein
MGWVGTNVKTANAAIVRITEIDGDAQASDDGGDDCNSDDDGDEPDDFVIFDITDFPSGTLTRYATVDDSLFVCVIVDEDSFVSFDTNDYGTWNDPQCFFDDGDGGTDWDDCLEVEDEGTDQMTVNVALDGEYDLTDGVVARFDCEDDPGTAEVTISNDADTWEFDIRCFGEPDSATLTALPAKVETKPALGSTSHSLITMTIVDEDGDPVNPTGLEVDWSTDKCTIDGISFAEYFAGFPGDGLFAASLRLLDGISPFDGLNFDQEANDVGDPFDPRHFPNNRDSSLANFSPEVEFEQLTLPENTAARAVLHCDSALVTPGKATVVGEIDLPGDDIVKSVEVTVVGPPASISVTAAAASVECGKTVAITATILDAAGQNVSDHSLAEAVTNAGGVLGGTGAVVNQAGPVVPVSSTVTETFAGKATFYLVTSQANVGTYTVIVTTGGGGSVGSFQSIEGFRSLESNEDDFDAFIEFFVPDNLGGWWSTPPISGQVEVKCTAAPAVSAPATGTGTLAAPRTGDGGLVGAGSSSTLYSLAGALAFALAGVATLRFARR